MRPIKVLLMTTHLDTGGIPVYVVELALGLKRLGHQPVVVSDGGWMQKRLFEAGIPYYPVPCRTSSELNPKLWFVVFPRLLKILFRERPVLLHAHTRIMQVLARGLNLLTRIPTVTTCHGLYRFRVGRRLFRCWGRTVMAISEPSMERLVDQYKLAPPHQAALVVNGVDVKRFMAPVPPEAVEIFRQANGLWGDPVIGGIARLSPVKGLDLLLKAVPSLIQRYPQLQVLLVGDGPSREDLIRLAYHLGLEKRVILSHPLEDTRVALSAMKVFVAPALEEGFGLSIVEAMAAGVPVVASNVGGPASIIESGKSGILVPPADSEAIGKAVDALLGDPAKRDEMRRAGRERALKDFDIKRVVQEVEAVYLRDLRWVRSERS